MADTFSLRCYCYLDRMQPQFAAFIGTVTQGDLASWILAGSYTRRAPVEHAYEVGVSYGMQRYLGGNGEALAAMRDGSRNVGSMYAFDSWTIARPVRVSYGAKYARYDYLAGPGLFSPRISLTITPLKGLRAEARTRRPRATSAVVRL